MIDSKFHTANRSRLINIISNGIFVVSANSQMQSSNDSVFRFKQEANFWWLTGINKPDWLLVIDGLSKNTWLVNPNISDVHQVFYGSLQSDTAKKISGIDKVISQDELTVVLNNLSKKHKVVYMVGDPINSKYFDFVLNPAQQKLRQKLELIFDDVQDCNLNLAKLRAIKQPSEIIEIKKAINLTVEAFDIVKQKLPKLEFEYQVEAEFSYHFRRNGADGHAFDPIVASGQNACTLHYHDNNSVLKNNNLIIMDIGAQIGGYSADISRTYAVGRPTKRQIAVHQAVQTAHQQIIDIIRPGLKIADYQKHVDVIMQSALRELNLMKTTDDYHRYFPHSVSHGLGVDTHDSLGQPTEFLPGMVITVEPGIYIAQEGIGVRIEDDILITTTGCQNLSAVLSTSL
ncbi:MAG: aminopeptidase P family protein [Candidatus Saccharibacteria bacterium]